MPIFDAIDEFKTNPELREKLEKYSIRKKYKQGDVILNESSYINAIPIVASGVIKVSRTDEDGREILLYYLKTGDSCIMSFLGGIHHDTSKIKAEADDNDTELYFLPIEQVIHFNKEYPEWLNYIFKLYHRRFEELLEVVNAVAFKKVDERLVDLLHKKSLLNGSKIITVSHEQLAQELGTARVVVSRLLKQLEESGKVKLGRNKIQLIE